MKLPSSWVTVQLRDVCTIGAGDSAPIDGQYFIGGTIPFVRMQDVGRVGIDMYVRETVDKVTEDAAKSLRVWPKNSLLFPKSGASILLNHRALLNEPSCVVSHLAILVPSEVLLPEYLYFISLTIDAARIVPDSGYPSLRLSDLERVQIPLPALSEQQYIVTILQYANELRRKRSEANELFHQLLPALFSEMFGDPIKPKKNWGPRQLSDFVSITASLVDPKKEEYLQFPHVGSDSIEETTGRLFNIRPVSAAGSISGKFVFNEKHVLYSKIRPALRKVATPEFTGLCSADIYPLSFDSDQVTRQFLAQLLRTNHFTAFVNRSSGRAQIPKINRDDLLKYITILPDIEIQRQFEQQANLIIQVREQNEESSNEIDSLFQSVVARAFTGELTETWRQENISELREPIKQRDEWLAAHGVRRPEPIPTTTEEKPAVTDDILLTRLSGTQQRVYSLARNHPNPYFTLQTLWEGQDDDDPLDRDEIGSGLSMLEALGAILKVSVPVSPTGEAFFQNVYRLAGRNTATAELQALNNRYPNIRISDNEDPLSTSRA